MKFSILIPTKERNELCINAIRSALNQNVELEVVVSDASFGVELENACKEINDKRLFYYRSAPDTIMTNNWLNAYNNSTGDYIIIIGDDDYLVKDVLCSCEEMINSTKCSAIALGYIGYNEMKRPGYLDYKKYQSKDKVNKVEFSTMLKAFLADGSIPHPSQLVLNRRLYNLVNEKFGATYDFPYPDFSFMPRLFTLNEVLFQFNKPQVLVGRYPKSFTNSTYLKMNAFQMEIGSDYTYTSLSAPVTYKGLIEIILRLQQEDKNLNYKVGWQIFYFEYLFQILLLKKNKMEIGPYLINLHKALWNLNPKYEILVLILVFKKIFIIGASKISILKKKKNQKDYFDDISKAANYISEKELKLL